MELSEEYRLSTYEDYGPLEGQDKIRLVRQKLDGSICVQKRLRPECLQIYQFLQSHPSPYFPEIKECMLEGDDLIIIESYVEGESIAQLVSEQCFTEEETVRIARQLCEALKILHHADPPIINRDIKAENILLTPEGQVFLVDFDIAREYEAQKTMDTEVLGTRSYAAPEQFGFSQTDARTDIYALGILLNFMVTGKFPGESLTEGHLQEIVQTCVSLDPANRYQSVEALEEALRTCPGLFEAPEKTTSKTAPVSSWALPGFRSHVLWKMLIAGLGYLSLTGIAFSLTLVDEYGDPELFGVQMFARVLLWLALLGTVFYVWNYRGIREKLPFFHTRHPLLRLLADGMVFLVLILAALFLAALVSVILA